MRTPAGKECRHYYEDFNRGRRLRECRLIQSNPASMRWVPGDCRRCSVPDILNANASPDLSLELTIRPRLLGFGRRADVVASCLRHHLVVIDPFVGCPECNAERPGLDVFRRALGADDE